MKPSLSKLRNYFKLEAKNGYQNNAVIGGLERMLEPWAAEARADQLPENIIQAVTIRLRDYHRLSEDSRKETLRGLWNRIQRELGEGQLPNETVQPAEKPTPKEQPKAKEVEEQTASVVAAEAPKPAPTREPRPQLAPGKTADLNVGVTTLKNVGPKYAETLERLNIRTLGDMLYHFPHRYDDYSKMKPINRLGYGEKVSVIGSIQSVSARATRGGRTKLTEAVINDGSAAMRVTWFNQPWIKKRLRQGMQIVLSGQTEQYLGRLTMNNPDWTPVEERNLLSEGIVPVYALTAKLTQKWLRDKLHAVVTDWAPKVHDPLPSSMLDDASLMDLSVALQQIHYPASWDQLKEARHRLAFDEIFLLQLGVMQQKQNWASQSAKIYQAEDGWLGKELGKLPFTLTAAQQRTLNEVVGDLSSGHPMNRLIQGDVGSGKTVIAALAIALVCDQGSQAALMAPTSILAEQHYKNLLQMLTQNGGPLTPEQIHLMVGATSESEKIEIRAGLANGEISIVIGTHALIEDPVEFHDLQLVIIDEQHRFGVSQRAALRAKGSNPHLMVMTATPIPRSLALTVYGDLDVSVIDEMPPGRQEIETHVLYPKERERAYSLLRRQVEAGHQAFVIYPLVEESDKTEEKAAVEEHDRLKKEIFPDLKLGLLHGRMTPSDKDTVMTKFRDREFDILVSTSVVEVGVDIPNTTVMLIEGAHRFGLAQLHQFRGRVGRGKAKSYCILIPSKADAVENDRLQAMAETNDGFVLAERDLEQRGPGEFLGSRQSGYSELRLASLTDVKLIQKARQHAQQLFHRDPDLIQAEHKQLAETLARFWSRGSTDIS
ncbi:MAG: ATP-dependent DNA helicase RecG [Anaerolineales bacterium]|nr:ATP-dependent DNA helicase RecG [Chloroflexota bacterium]MBL6980722.1 ATP-dependent DNA helicase RecG [Anaerolineales bacterium]